MFGRFLKYWAPVLVWMLVIFGASTHLGSSENTSRFIGPFLHWLNPNMSKDTIDKVHYCVRKTAHFTEYAMLGLLILRAVRSEPHWVPHGMNRKILLSILLAALYASSDEFHQIFVPGRESSVRDVMIDTCGASFGILLYWLACCRQKRHE